jgi:hypothetical protein
MCRLGAVLVFSLLMCLQTFGGEYRLSNGDVLKGEAASFNDDGLVVRLDIGGFSPRIPWGKFTQETLTALMQNPEAKEFVEPYLDVPLEVKEKAKEKKKEIKVKEPPRVPLVEGKTGFFASMANPLGLTLLGILYLANLYAALEIARFRSRPIPLVVGISAIAPILGPILFVSLPPGNAVAAAPAETAEAPPAATESVNPMQGALPAGMQGGGLGLAGGGHGAKTAGNPNYNQVYTRSNSTFDRKFFESKFTGFFRVVPMDPEKDLVIVVKTAKQELIGTRISRISAAEIHFQLQRGTEASVPFGEITEVSVRPKGTK